MESGFWPAFPPSFHAWLCWHTRWPIVPSCADASPMGSAMLAILAREIQVSMGEVMLVRRTALMNHGSSYACTYPRTEESWEKICWCMWLYGGTMGEIMLVHVTADVSRGKLCERIWLNQGTLCSYVTGMTHGLVWSAEHFYLYQICTI